jgi:hypothetical protein
MGTLGLNWQFSGVGNFSSHDSSDMLLRNSNTGGIEVYDIANNQITNASFIGTVDLDWQFSGVGNFSGVPGETHLLLRNSKTGGPLNPICIGLQCPEIVRKRVVQKMKIDELCKGDSGDGRAVISMFLIRVDGS